MSEPVQNFRTAFHGFNREDVVRFLETATARHTAEVNQLRDEIARLEGDLSLLRMRSGDGASQEELEALQAENARLKAQVEELETQLTEPAATPIRDETNWKDEELAAYRRAETVERQARNRAAQMYHRVNGLIADLAARMDGSKAEMTAAAEALGQALDQLQLALDGGQSILTEGTATLRALELEHPADSEEKR
ncbi:MAG: hypothetical protein KHX25_01535 [Firmicutes bacterium]|jgi:cell division septum initiation protein DivIVA|nr:hypothetical protein [Bacillota bacterium]